MFSTNTDIANFACVSLGVARIGTLGDNSKQAIELNAIFDKVRQAELRSRVWRFACRKAVLRSVTSTTQLINFAATGLNYASGTTYQQGDIVNDTTANVGNSGTTLYISLLASNVGNTPSSSPAQWMPYFGPVTADTWSSSVSYYAGEIANSGSHLYLSVSSGNLNQTITGGAPWTAAKLAGTDSNYSTLFIPYPIGSFNNSQTRTYYRMPWGYLRVAPQDPKIAGGTSQITAAGMQYSDWQFEGQYLLTASAGPVIFRFVGDISNVLEMDPLFCRAFGARLAYEACETITGDPQLKQEIAQDYDRFIAQARSVNSIEQGSTDPIEEEILLSRLPAQMHQAPAARGNGGR